MASASTGVGSFEAQFAQLDLSDSHVESRGMGKGIWRVMPDEGHVVSASYDHTARVWEVVESEAGFTFGRSPRVHGHQKEVLCLLKFGALLGTGSSDGTLKLLDRNGREEKEISEGRGSGFYSCVAVDGQSIATGACHNREGVAGWRHDIKVWNVSERPRVEYTLRGHDGGISSMVMCGDRIVSASADKTVRVWNTTSMEAISILAQHTDYIYGMGKVDNNGVITGSRDKTVREWDLEREEVTGLYRDGDETAHSSTIYDVDVHENQVVTASRDGYVKLWDRRTREVTHSLSPDDGFVYTAKFSGDGCYVFAGTAGKEAKKHQRADPGVSLSSHLVGWDLRV